MIFEGELRSLQEIYKTSPGFCPEPYGWGRFASDPEMYFLLVEFRDIGASVSPTNCWGVLTRSFFARNRSSFFSFFFLLAHRQPQLILATSYYPSFEPSAGRAL